MALSSPPHDTAFWSSIDLEVHSSCTLESPNSLLRNARSAASFPYMSSPARIADISFDVEGNALHPSFLYVPSSLTAAPTRSLSHMAYGDLSSGPYVLYA